MHSPIHPSTHQVCAPCMGHQAPLCLCSGVLFWVEGGVCGSTAWSVASRGSQWLPEDHSVHVLYPLPRRRRQGKFPWMGKDRPLQTPPDGSWWCGFSHGQPSGTHPHYMRLPLSRARSLSWVFPVDFPLLWGLPASVCRVQSVRENLAGMPCRAAKLRPETLASSILSPTLYFASENWDPGPRHSDGWEVFNPSQYHGPKNCFLWRKNYYDFIFEIKNIKLTYNSHTVGHSDLNYNNQFEWVHAYHSGNSPYSSSGQFCPCHHCLTSARAYFTCSRISSTWYLWYVLVSVLVSFDHHVSLQSNQFVACFSW